MCQTLRTGWWTKQKQSLPWQGCPLYKDRYWTNIQSYKLQQQNNRVKQKEMLWKTSLKWGVTHFSAGKAEILPMLKLWNSTQSSLKSNRPKLYSVYQGCLLQSIIYDISNFQLLFYSSTYDKWCCLLIYLDLFLPTFLTVLLWFSFLIFCTLWYWLSSSVAFFPSLLI